MIPDEDKLNLLHEIAVISSTGSEPGTVFRQVRDMVEQLLDCDTVLVLTNDQEKNQLTAANPFNNLGETFNNLTIPYTDELVVDLLINKRQKSRLAPEKPLLPSAKSELYVPIQSPRDILGCLYLCRVEENAFSPGEIKLLDLALGYISMFMERSAWEKQQVDLLNIKQKNKGITKSFLESLQQPAIIIDTFRDQVFEVNSVFAEMLNYGKAELSKAPFTTVCRDHLSVKNLSPGIKQNLITNWMTRDNTILNLKTVFTFLENVDKGLVLLIFQNEQDSSTELKNFWLHELFASLSQVQFLDIQKDYSNAAGIVLNLFNAVGLSIHSRGPHNQMTLLAAWENKKKNAEPVDSKKIKLYSNIMAQLPPDNKKPLYIHDTDTTEWKENLALLKKNDIRSMTSVPLEINNENMGMFNLYFKEPVTWDTKDKIKLASICQISSNFLFAPQLKTDLNMQRERVHLFEYMTKQLFSDNTIETNLVYAVRDLYKSVEFDFFSLTLFDDSGNIDKAIDLTWSQLLNAFDPPLKHAASEHDLPVQVYQTLKSSTAVNSMQPLRLPFSMPAHTSVVLVSGERYLGNMALGRLEKTPFTRNENELLKLVSGIISTALICHQQPGKSDLLPKLEEFQSKISIQHLQQKARQDIMHTICMAVKSTLNGSHCKSVFLAENTRILDLFDWLPTSVPAKLSPPKIKKMLLALKKSKIPILFPDSDHFLRDLCTDDAAIPDDMAINPFIISPVIINNQIQALVLLVLEESDTRGEEYAKLLRQFCRQTEQWLIWHQQYHEILDKNTSLQDYAHLVSHELKSPLQTIKNYASILKEDLGKSIPPDTKQYLTRLLHNLDNMESMITELLTISSLEALELSSEEIAIKPLLQKTEQSLGALIDMRKATIKIKEPLPDIYGNPTGIEHIFSNLISNAIKYTKENIKPVVTISAKKTKGAVEFTIADNGMGIAKEDQKKIFGPFFKKNVNVKHNSSGLGLTIVTKIIGMHGGTITLDSTPGSGSKFIFTLPQAEKKLE